MLIFSSDRNAQKGNEEEEASLAFEHPLWFYENIAQTSSFPFCAFLSAEKMSIYVRFCFSIPNGFHSHYLLVHGTAQHKSG